MRAYLVVPRGFVDIGKNSVNAVSDRLSFNPYGLEGGVVGFHLRGDSILPVVDLNDRLELDRTEKHTFVVLKSVVFRVWYSEMVLERPEGSEIDLDSLEKEVLADLGVDPDGRSG